MKANNNLPPTRLSIPLNSTLVKATGVLTSDGTNFANDEAFVLGANTYTFKSTLTAAVAATQVLTSDNTNVAKDEKVVIGSRTYQFTDAIPEDEYGSICYVLIGADADASLTNLANAINDAVTGKGTTRSTSARAHEFVTAGAISAHAFTITARTAGTTANSIVTTETSAHLSWGAGTMSGGVNTVANQIKIAASADLTLDNVKAAINATGTPGTEYSVGTVVHPTCAATTNTATAQTFEHSAGGVAGNAIATTETCLHASFGGSTMSGGGGTVGKKLIGDTGVIRSIVSICPQLTGTPTYTVQVVNSDGEQLYITGSLNENATTITAKEMMVSETDYIIVTASTTVEDNLPIIVNLR